MSGGTTGIQWTDATWNPVVGCTPVSPGCLNCYAATMARRLEGMGQKDYQPRQRDIDGRDVTGLPGLQDDDNDRICRIAEVRGGRAVFTGEVRTLEHKLTAPLHWKKPRMIFVNSMSDLFHEAVPFEFIDKVFAVAALCPRHTFQVLTKRPERMAEYMSDHGRLTMVAQQAAYTDGEASMGVRWPLPNVWLGTSVEDQARADERIPHLLRCPAAVRFLSCEPLLGAVDLRFRREVLTDVMDLGDRPEHLRGRYPFPGAEDKARTRRKHVIDWVIVGGESGANTRPCDVGHIRSIVAQCKAAGVPCFVKQMGANVECRNDYVLDWLDEVGMGLDYVETSRVGMQGDPVRVMLNDRKGGDMAEWPEDLRVREMPAVSASASP